MTSGLSKKFGKKKSLTDKQKAEIKRQKILRSPTKLYKHRDEFTKQEIDEALKRFEWERRLSEFSMYELNTGKRYVDAALGNIDTGVRTYKLAKKTIGLVRR